MGSTSKRPSDSPSGDGHDATRPRLGGILRAAVIVCAVDVLGLVGYSIALGVASRTSRGASVNAAGVEILIYLIFAAMMVVLATGIRRRKLLARTPFLLSQIFVVIIGYTVFAGDGSAVTVVGSVIMALGVAGVFVALSPAFVAGLSGEPD